MRQTTKPFALCVDNTDHAASSVLGKAYRLIPDPRAAKNDLLLFRVAREEAVDILYTRLTVEKT